MTDMYGYANSLSQGQSFNNQTQNFNDGVLVSNQRAQDVYKQKVKNQPGTLSDDKTKKEEDQAFYGFTDGSGAIGSTVGLIQAGNAIKETGLAGYAGDEFKGRMNSIGETYNRIGEKAPQKPPADMVPTSETTAAGTVATDTETTINPVGQAGDTVATAGEETLQGGDDALRAGTGAIESSGLKTALIKKVLGKTTLGAVGEAGLSTASEIGGKALGDFGGIADVVHGISNVWSGCGTFFQGESTGDKLQELGAGLDLVGTVFPPLELVGGITSLVGGIMDGYEDLKNDGKKRDVDATTVPPPKLTATKVTPAYSSMGLAASAPVSAKSSITGSSSF
tara:strand:+ start:14050 stop:15060 length:1011 start_codon:yes stop_codon:yes gene_type:complete